MSVFDRKVVLSMNVELLLDLWGVLSKAEQANVGGAITAKRYIKEFLTEEETPEQLIASLNTDDWKSFHQAIIKMNETYELPVNQAPTLLTNQALRTQQFIDILNKEIDEGYGMLQQLQGQLYFDSEKQLESLTDLADWYGDIIVYVTSEAIRNGIPLMEVLQIIMESNMTKLGEDGKPIKDENDKFLKGPNFVTPEARIKELLRSKLSNVRTENKETSK